MSSIYMDVTEGSEDKYRLPCPGGPTATSGAFISVSSPLVTEALPTNG